MRGCGRRRGLTSRVDISWLVRLSLDTIARFMKKLSAGFHSMLSILADLAGLKVDARSIIRTGRKADPAD